MTANVELWAGERGFAASIPVLTVVAGVPDVPRAKVQLGKGGALQADLVVRAGGHAFVVDVLDAAAPGPVAAHAEHVVTAVRKVRRKATPLPAVPYMTEPCRVRGRGGGRTHSTILLAAARDVSWGAAGSCVFESTPHERVSSTTTVRSQDEYARLLLERNHRRQRWENQPAVGVRVEQLARKELLHLEAARAWSSSPGAAKGRGSGWNRRRGAGYAKGVGEAVRRRERGSVMSWRPADVAL